MPAARESVTEILSNARVRVLDAAGSHADSIAWQAGKIVAVGALADVQRSAGAGARVTDARGAEVLPGFLDAHQHPAIHALYGGGTRLAAPRVTSIESLLSALAEASQTLLAGEWLVATSWDEALLDERRPPTRAELDDAVPDRPVFALHYSCHRAVANSRALELAGIDRSTPDPSGGQISRARRGEPDGLLIERGMSRVETLARTSLRARDADGFLTRLGQHFDEAVSLGITRIADAAVTMDLVPLYREAVRRGLVRVPTVLLPVGSNGYLETPWEALDGAPTGHREGNLVVGPVKLVLDGAPGCAMCLGWAQAAGVALHAWALSIRTGSLDPMRASLSVGPRMGRKLRTGIKIYQPEEARGFVASAVERGFSVACHAEGNDAIDMAVAAYEASAGLDRAGVARLEHVLFLDEELTRRVAGTGAAVVTQAGFFSLPAFLAAPAIPNMRTLPLRWLIDQGVRVVGSSDYPVTSMDPLDGIRAAVFRTVSRGRVQEPDQCIELDEALASYTRVAAEVLGCLDECGTLEPGKRADLVVLDGPLASRDDLRTARVRATVIAGELAFGSLG